MFVCRDVCRFGVQFEVQLEEIQQRHRLRVAVHDARRVARTRASAVARRVRGRRRREGKRRTFQTRVGFSLRFAREPRVDPRAMLRSGGSIGDARVRVPFVPDRVVPMVGS